MKILQALLALILLDLAIISTQLHWIQQSLDAIKTEHATTEPAR